MIRHVNASPSNLKDSFERSERGGKFFSGFRATYEARPMPLDQPRLDHLLWLSQDKILRIVVNRNGGPPTVASDHLSLSHVPSRPRSYISIGRRLSTPFAIRENLETHALLLRETITLGGRLQPTNTMLSNRMNSLHHCRSTTSVLTYR